MVNGDAPSSKALSVRYPCSCPPVLSSLIMSYCPTYTSKPPPALVNFTNALIQHLQSYPIVSDSISTFKSNPYGQKSMALADNTYNNFVAPFVPYAQRPYSLVKPYVAKADDIANTGLSKVDANFPIVKEDSKKVYGTVLDFAFMPLRLAGDGKNYVLGTYSSEYKKCGGDGLVSGGKAFITTGLVVTSDTLAWLSNFLAAKKEQTKEIAKEKKEVAKEKTGNK